jgi:AraC-like DNA-binding protein
MRRNHYGTVVADVNQVLFFHEHQPYQIKHPLPGGDVSTSIAISPPVLVGLIQTFDPTVEGHPHTPFSTGHCPAEPHQHLKLRQILNATSKADASLEVEEDVLMLTASVIRNMIDAARGEKMPQRPETARNQRDIANRAKIVLGERFRERLTLDQVARATCTSPYHLCRVFNAETGVSLHRYLQRLRLLNALENLAENPRARKTEVALDLGFSSHSHFSAAFRHEFGMPPSVFCRLASNRVIRDLRELSTAISMH